MLTKIFNQKKAVSDIVLAPEVIEKIPNINDDPEICSIAEQILNFEDMLKAKKLELDNTQNGPVSNVSWPG